MATRAIAYDNEYLNPIDNIYFEILLLLVLFLLVTIIVYFIDRSQCKRIINFAGGNLVIDIVEINLVAGLFVVFDMIFFFFFYDCWQGFGNYCIIKE